MRCVVLWWFRWFDKVNIVTSKSEIRKSRVHTSEKGKNLGKIKPKKVDLNYNTCTNVRILFVTYLPSFTDTFNSTMDYTTSHSTKDDAKTSQLMYHLEIGNPPLHRHPQYHLHSSPTWAILNHLL